jgi:parallel beta-helix repeat protein
MLQKNKVYYIITLLVLNLLVSGAYAKTYFVSSSGSDASAGTVANPLKTIKKAASLVNAGDTVLVEGGTYMEENIQPKSSGTANAMIVFKPQAGTGDVIIKHPGTSIDDNNPVFGLEYRSYIWIEGFVFKDYEFGKSSIRISNGGNNVVINNRFESLGNDQVGSWDGNTIVWLGWTTKNVIRNNYFVNNFGDGVGYFGDNCTHNLICDNTFVGMKGKLRSWGGSYKFSAAMGGGGDVPDGNNIFAFNYATDIHHGVWLDRHGSDNIVLRNYTNDGDNGIFNESRCANNIIQENISVNMDNGFMSSHYPTTGWTIDPRWVNNVAYKNKVGFNIHKSERDEFRNNIAFNNTESNLIFTEEALSNAPHVFNNNLWYSEGNTKSIEFKDENVSVSEFQEAVGSTGGLSVDPMFTNPSDGPDGFTLQQTSPAINAADNGLDLGAFAYYPVTPLGYDSSLQLSGVLVDFVNPVLSIDRGNSTSINIRLSRASTDTVSVEIKPIAGDAVINKDFTINQSPVIFLPGETNKSFSVEAMDTARFSEIVALRFGTSSNALPGGRDVHLIRVNKTPLVTAFAGANQNIWDLDKNGTETVALDATGSSNPNSDALSYEWYEGQNLLTTGIKTSVELETGEHLLTLVVTDSQGYNDSDDLIVNVIENAGFWFEAECGNVGSLWDVVEDDEASNGEYVTASVGENFTEETDIKDAGTITFDFEVTDRGAYTLFARVICPSANDDSFWLKIDDKSFSRWNSITGSSTWIWAKSNTTYNLSAGNHTLTIALREDGAKLDKVWLTDKNIEFDGVGADAFNCETSSVSSPFVQNIRVFPNPAQNELNVRLFTVPANVKMFNMNGIEVFSRNDVTGGMNIDVSAYPSGLYFLQVSNGNERMLEKIIVK